jgi:hypothetical protein
MPTACIAGTFHDMHCFPNALTYFAIMEILVFCLTDKCTLAQASAVQIYVMT